MKALHELGLFRAGILYDKVRSRLQDPTISDCTIRRWRAQAFVEQKSVYSNEDVDQIVNYVFVLYQVGTVQPAREEYALILDSRKETPSHASDPEWIDVRAESCA
jgi:hypothetical protein